MHWEVCGQEKVKSALMQMMNQILSIGSVLLMCACPLSLSTSGVLRSLTNAIHGVQNAVADTEQVGRGKNGMREQGDPVSSRRRIRNYVSYSFLSPK